MKLPRIAAILTALYIGLGPTSVVLSQNAPANTTTPTTTTTTAAENDDGFPWGLLGLLGLAGLAGLRRRDDHARHTTTTVR